jgi:hypothetical protein
VLKIEKPVIRSEILEDDVIRSESVVDVGKGIRTWRRSQKQEGLF